MKLISIHFFFSPLDLSIPSNSKFVCQDWGSNLHSVGVSLCVKIGERFPLAIDITSSLGLSIRMNLLLSVLG